MAHFDACTCCGYSATGEPFGACSATATVQQQGAFRRLSLPRVIHESSRLLNSVLRFKRFEGWIKEYCNFLIMLASVVQVQTCLEVFNLTCFSSSYTPDKREGMLVEPL